jgi:hypothetical protein
VAKVGTLLAGRALMQIYQAIDSVRSFETILVLFAQPRDPFVEERQDLLCKTHGNAILLCHGIPPQLPVVHLAISRPEFQRTVMNWVGYRQV